MNYFAYFSEIEETFVRRRGKNLLISPLDWALIQSWKEREIPLNIVLRAINLVFDAAAQRSGRRPAIKSLIYCRDEVEAQFAVWLESRVGDDAGESDLRLTIPKQEILAHLASLDADLRTPRPELNGAWLNFSAKVLNALQTAKNEFEKKRDLDELEEKLSAIDRRVDEVLTRIYDRDNVRQIEIATETQLKPHRRSMNDEIYQQTLQNLLVKNLREKAALRRMSLFYL